MAKKIYNTFGYSTSMKEYLERLNALDVLEPENGLKYFRAVNPYHIGKGRLIRISERQRNIAVLVATQPKVPVDEIMIMAGYTIGDMALNAWGYKTPVSKAKDLLRKKYKKSFSTNAIALKNYLQEQATSSLAITPEWVLGQQVSLYEEAKHAKEYTVARGLLADISMHKMIDAKVSNRIEITDKIDYAAELRMAESRTLPNPDIIDVEVEDITEDEKN